MCFSLYNLWGLAQWFYYFAHQHGTQLVIRGKRKEWKENLGWNEDSIGTIPSTANLIYILNTSNSAINIVVFFPPPINHPSIHPGNKRNKNCFNILKIYMHAFPYAAATLLKRHVKRHLTRVAGWLREFSGERKNCREKSFGNHLKLLIVRSEFRGVGGQQTSGITKTKLKFFIVNKRRESGSRGRKATRWIWCRSYLLIWSHSSSSSPFRDWFRLFSPFTQATTDDVAGMKRRLNCKSSPSAEFRSRFSTVLVCW